MTITQTSDSIFSENAQTILCKRYYWHLTNGGQAKCQRCGSYHETEDDFIGRISLGNKEYEEKLIRPLRFLPNSPTLFNVGTGNGTLSACFKFDVEDTLFDSPDGIWPVATKAVKVLRAGGGVGYYLDVRPEGSLVNSTHRSALGPLGVMRILHVLAKEITQGGKRDAAQMAILHCEHPDLEKFIHCKDDDPDALGTFNISVAITDEWMHKATTKPNSKEAKLLREMSESAWKTGDPGVFFINTAERGNPTPWAGKLTGTNPCGEVPLLRNEPCNLGSIDVSKFFIPAHTLGRKADIDWFALGETVCLATRYLDDVLDLNVFPDPEIDAAAKYTRKLGLGVCGFADLLAMMKIHYDSDEAVQLGERIMHLIHKEASEESARMGLEKGIAPCWVDHSASALRNATVTCIAPTGTIAILMDASSGIEPHFRLENSRTMGDGTVLMEKVGFTDGFVPHTANDIDYDWHVKHQAAFQKYTDLAVSKTINLPESATPDTIFNAYTMMWQSFCKGGTVYRDGSRVNQVLKGVDLSYKAEETIEFLKGVNVVNQEAIIDGVEAMDTGFSFEVIPDASLNDNIKHAQKVIENTLGFNNGSDWRDVLPMTRMSTTHKFEVGDVEGYVTVGEYDDGQPGEIFLKLARQGSTMDGFADWLAQVTSLAFQVCHKYGIPFTVITNKWLSRKFEPSGFTINKDIPKADSIADYLAQWLHKEYNKVDTGAVILGVNDLHTVETNRGGVCPDCGSQTVFQEGCEHCPNCGFERC